MSSVLPARALSFLRRNMVNNNNIIMLSLLFIVIIGWRSLFGLLFGEHAAAQKKWWWWWCQQFGKGNCHGCFAEARRRGTFSITGRCSPEFTRVACVGSEVSMVILDDK